MLGHGRITFETPNVIDPGDSVPSTPSRSLQSDFANRGSNSRAHISPPDEFRRGVYKPSLSRTIKIDYQDDADDEPTDLLMPVELDVEYAEEKKEETAGPVSPTMEQTRLFAAAMLNESERRDGSSRYLGSPVKKLFARKRDRDEEYLRNNLGLQYPMDTWRKDRRRRCRNTIILLSSIAVIFVIFGVAMGMHGDATDAMTDRFGTTSEFLLENKIASQQDLAKKDSPQYRAANWIANQDDEYLEIPVQADPFRFIQRYTLAVLYYSMGGEEWTASLRFLSSDHECSWNEMIPDENKEIFAVGVSCDQNLNVNSLLIPSNNLKGSIPDEIRHLTHMKFISLKHNGLSGAIPPALEKLTMLEYFDVKVNNMEGTIPDLVGELSHLQVLGLSKNNFSGSLPQTIGTLRLRTLAVDDNSLTGDLGSLRLMSALEYLYAQNNSFTGNLFTGILMAEMPNLVEVDLSDNELTAEEVSPHLFALPKLKLLDASGNKVTGSFPDTIPENSSLEYLSFRGNSIKSSIPASISNLRRLTHLDLEENSLTGTLPSSIAGLKTLVNLYLGKNSFSNTGIPEELKDLTDLKELSLDSLGLQGEIPVWIGDLTNLNLLDLRENQLSGSPQVDFSKLQSLKFLLLSDNKLTGTIPQSLGLLASLEVLSLFSNNLTGDANPICNGVSGIEWIATDCSDQITCSCCDQCCSGDNCYAEKTFDDHEQNNWSQHQAHAEHAFNPHILEGGIQPRDELSRGGNV